MIVDTMTRRFLVNAASEATLASTEGLVSCSGGPSVTAPLGVVESSCVTLRGRAPHRAIQHTRSNVFSDLNTNVMSQLSRMTLVYDGNLESRLL